MRETDLLDRFLERERHVRFSWDSFGTGDCLMYVAGWGILLNGVDFAAHLRGTYCDEAGARRAIAAQGGAIAFFDRVAGERRRDDDYRRGDIGLLGFGDWHLGLICTGTMWVCRAGAGGNRMIKRPPDLVWAPNAARAS